MATPQHEVEGPAMNRLTLCDLDDVVNPSGNPVSFIPNGATISFSSALKKWVVANSL